jgi:hypothetical protein
MRGRFLDFLLCVAVALVVLFVASLALIPSCDRTHRRVAIVGAAHWLDGAYRDYTNRGYLTNSAQTYRVSVASNAVTIGSSHYQCVLQLPVFHMGQQEGTLAVTSNRIFIWFGSNSPPMIVSNGFRSPLFGH